jgi:hypothetical protein
VLLLIALLGSLAQTRCCCYPRSSARSRKQGAATTRVPGLAALFLLLLLPPLPLPLPLPLPPDDNISLPP